MNNVDLEARIKTLMEKGGMAAAYEELARVLGENPRDEQALRMRATFRAMAGEWPPLIADLNTLLALSPSASLKGMLANAYKCSGDLKSALAEYDRELSLEPGNPFLHRFRARTRIAAGDHAGAREDLTASAINSGEADAWIELAIFEAQAGNAADALGHLDQAVKTKPGYNTYLHRGIMRAQVLRWKEAIEDLDIAMTELLGIENSWSYQQQALSCRAKCKFMLDDDAAMADFDAALELKPDDAEALCLRGNMRVGRGDKDGLKDLDESVRLAPDVPATYAYRGDVHYGLGDKPAALRDYHKAIELDAGWKETLEERLRLAGS